MILTPQLNIYFLHPTEKHENNMLWQYIFEELIAIVILLHNNWHFQKLARFFSGFAFIFYSHTGFFIFCTSA
jgi:hypothetical protein